MHFYAPCDNFNVAAHKTVYNTLTIEVYIPSKGLKTNNLQAVDGKPPKIDIGWVGAVGHIHLICTKHLNNDLSNYYQYDHTYPKNINLGISNMCSPINS